MQQISQLHGQGPRSRLFVDADRPRLRPSITHHGYLHLKLLAAQLARELRIADPSITVDVGCGAKPYAQIVPGRYVGLDRTTAHGLPDAIGCAEAVPLTDGCADVVLSTQQLEHVDDPSAVVREAARLLRPGGTLLLSTHGVWPHHPDPHDLWRWTEEGLTRIIEDGGLSVSAVHHQGEIFTTGILLLTYPLGGLRRHPSRPIAAAAGALLAIANLICHPLDQFIGRLGRRHYASPSYLVVARRGAQETR